MPKARLEQIATVPDNSKERIFTVTQLAGDIKLILENTFGYVWVEGEISNFKAHTSGHFYFSLKDETALLSAAMFSRANREVKFKVENGLKVVCYGKISSYGPYSQYQIIVERIEPKGIGGLQLAFEQLKRKLGAEGLFAPEHKRPLPYLPEKIGIITSISGAAIKDMLKVLDRRFSDSEIVIVSAQVQGVGAKEDIAHAIEEMNEYNQSLPAHQRIEVLIVGRGGGSIEDLWAFNEEIVARAIYNSAIPVISAVGHEQDWTIADLVADVRAATPSVAAELVMPKKEDLSNAVKTHLVGLARRLGDLIEKKQAQCQEYAYRISLTAEQAVMAKKTYLDRVHHNLLMASPVAQLEHYKEKILGYAQTIAARMDSVLVGKKNSFSNLLEKLNTLNPLMVLERGYSITFLKANNKSLTNAKDVLVGDGIKTRLSTGELISTVTEVHSDGGY